LLRSRGTSLSNGTPDAVHLQRRRDPDRVETGDLFTLVRPWPAPFTCGDAQILRSNKNGDSGQLG
jgi:hypothetical protein